RHHSQLPPQRPIHNILHRLASLRCPYPQCPVYVIGHAYTSGSPCLWQCVSSLMLSGGPDACYHVSGPSGVPGPLPVLLSGLGSGHFLDPHGPDKVRRIIHLFHPVGGLFPCGEGSEWGFVHWDCSCDSHVMPTFPATHSPSNVRLDHHS